LSKLSSILLALNSLAHANSKLLYAYKLYQNYHQSCLLWTHLHMWYWSMSQCYIIFSCTDICCFLTASFRSFRA
jgi:hypothetical protein